MNKRFLWLLLALGAAASITGSVLVMTMGFAALPIVISVIGGIMASVSFQLLRRMKPDLTKVHSQGPTNSTTYKTIGAALQIIGGLGLLAAFAAAPFTGGLSIIVLVVAASIAGLGLLTFAGGHAVESNQHLKRPTPRGMAAQFFTGLLKGIGFFALAFSAATAALSAPFALGLTGAPFYAGMISSIAGSLSIAMGSLMASALQLLITAAYVAGGGLVLAAVGHIAHKGLRRGNDITVISLDVPPEQNQVLPLLQPVPASPHYRYLQKQGMAPMTRQDITNENDEPAAKSLAKQQAYIDKVQNQRRQAHNARVSIPPEPTPTNEMLAEQKHHTIAQPQ